MDTSNSEQAGNLDGKWWYRLLRVVLIVVYVLALGTGLGAIYDLKRPRPTVDSPRSLIVCLDGSTHTIAEITSGPADVMKENPDIGWVNADGATRLCAPKFIPEAPPHSWTDADGVVHVPRGRDGKLTERDIEDLRSLRALLPQGDSRIEAIDELLFSVEANYTVRPVYKVEGSWIALFSVMAIAWLGTHLALVTLRGAVLYVAVGKFLPVSGLRGWLVL